MHEISNPIFSGGGGGGGNRRLEFLTSMLNINLLRFCTLKTTHQLIVSGLIHNNVWFTALLLIHVMIFCYTEMNSLKIALPSISWYI